MKVIEANRANIDGRVGTSTSGSDDGLLRRCRLHRLRRLQHRLERILESDTFIHVLRDYLWPRCLADCRLAEQAARWRWRTIQQSIWQAEHRLWTPWRCSE